jgi:hypothetical protein
MVMAGPSRRASPALASRHENQDWIDGSTYTIMPACYSSCADIGCKTSRLAVRGKVQRALRRASEDIQTSQPARDLAGPFDPRRNGHRRG